MTKILKYFLFLSLFIILLDASRSPGQVTEADSDIEGGDNNQNVSEPVEEYLIVPSDPGSVFRQRSSSIRIEPGLAGGLALPGQHNRAPVYSEHQEHVHMIMQINPIVLLLRILTGFIMFYVFIEMMDSDDLTATAIRRLLYNLLGME